MIMIYQFIYLREVNILVKRRQTTHRNLLYKDKYPQKSDSRNQTNKGHTKGRRQTLFHPYVFSCDNNS